MKSKRNITTIHCNKVQKTPSFNSILYQIVAYVNTSQFNTSFYTQAFVCGMFLS